MLNQILGMFILGLRATESHKNLSGGGNGQISEWRSWLGLFLHHCDRWPGRLSFPAPYMGGLLYLIFIVCPARFLGSEEYSEQQKQNSNFSYGEFVCSMVFVYMYKYYTFSQIKQKYIYFEIKNPSVTMKLHYLSSVLLRLSVTSKTSASLLPKALEACGEILQIGGCIFFRWADPRPSPLRETSFNRLSLLEVLGGQHLLPGISK